MTKIKISSIKIRKPSVGGVWTEFGPGLDRAGSKDVDLEVLKKTCSKARSYIYFKIIKVLWTLDRRFLACTCAYAYAYMRGS